jgi:hypothetical protein
MPSLSCPFCTHENPAGAKYCNECGSPLHLVLCGCGAVNNLTDAHCHRCGASVSGPRAPAQSVPLETELGEVEEQLRGLERQLEAPDERASRPGLRSVGGAHTPAEAFEQQRQDPMPALETPDATVAALLARRPAEDPRDRRPGYAAAALVLAIVAAVAAGASFYDRYAPWLERTASALRGPAAVAPSPGTGASGGAPIAGASPRAGNASTPMSPEPSRFDVPMRSRPGSDDASPPVAPIVSALQATDVPVESRAEADAGKPSAPLSAPPAPDPRCPPAVVAMALCERMAHADRR